MNFIRVVVMQLLGLLIFLTMPAYASNYSHSGQLAILSPLQMSAQEQLNFATIQKPTAPVVVHVTPDGQVGGDNTAIFENTSNISAGSYSITGSGDNSISISASSDDNISGIQYSGIEATYNDGSILDLMSGTSGLSAPGSSGKTLKLGAKLSVDQTVANGNYAPNFSLDINYE